VPDNQQGKRDATGEQDLRLAVAFEAAQDLYFLKTPADGLDFAVKLLGELIPSEAVSGCIYDINTDEFRFVAVAGTGATERRAAAVRGNVGLFAAAARSGVDTLIVPDLANEPRYDPDIDGRTDLLASNMAFFVLHRAGQLFGMLQIINREGPKGFREGDIAVGSYVANQVTAFLREKRGLGGR
jgi:GAF domain-containing protein